MNDKKSAIGVPGSRTEKEIFDELAQLCTRPGYAHAIAFFSYRDNVIGFGDELKSKDYTKLFSTEHPPWTWNTDLAISRPIVVIVCMLGSSKLRGLNSTHIHGTHVPVEEPFTASIADIPRTIRIGD
jgi:hypothetical protein